MKGWNVIASMCTSVHILIRGKYMHLPHSRNSMSMEISPSVHIARNNLPVLSAIKARTQKSPRSGALSSYEYY